jgi:hypothetical protein
MSRSLLKLALPLVLLFSGLLSLIRAQPYDDSVLRAFFAPPGDCPRPCFVGIRPGITPVEEAQEILQAHQWIASVNRYEATDGRGVAAFTAAWSGAQPEFIDGGEELWLGVEDHVVQALIIPTRIPLAHFWLMFGKPQYGGVREDVMPETSRPSAGYGAVYFDMDSFFHVSAFCPIESVWKLPVQWVLWPDLSPSNTPLRDDLPVQVYGACRNAMSNP